MSRQEQTIIFDRATEPAFSEAYREDGATREHWQYLLSSLDELGARKLDQRRLTLERILRDDGATYNDYSEGLTARPWRVDPIPLLIDSNEWNDIESGIRERAELLDLVLRDLYGERSLLRLGLVPPELIFSHPGFLRECQGITLPGKQQLILYAADMVRTPDGRVRVMSDRAQTPSGGGYALENRMVMSRVFPSLFRDSHVHRLSLYFNSLRFKLNALNPNGGAARVAVLTPGAYNETYFEHAYLANYLGFQLVQGRDLSVRNGYVWMKALDGLKRVDVILRRVDDVYCDPVELRGDSQLGVPGLLEVARMGRVAIANPLGSNVLENPALLRYLPDIARSLIGRDLRVPSVKTWWCGNPDDLEYVCANLRNLLIKPTYRRPGLYEVYGAELDDTKILAWQNRIRKNPYQYVAQEYVPCASAPSWHQGQLQPSTSILRTFAVATDNSYSVMPGGLTRANLDANNKIISNQRGSVSKDTWVLASEPEKRVSLRSPDMLQAPEDANELPSRVVENLFWMGRYTERAESALRLLRTVSLQINRTEALPAPVTRTLLSAVTHVTSTYPGFASLNPQLFKNPEPEFISILIDSQRAGSVSGNILSLIRTSEQVKEQLSNDTQRVINDIGDHQEELRKAVNQNGLTAAEDHQARLVTALLALTGLIHDSMTRDNGWHFMEMGRRLERALQIVNSMRALLAPKFEDFGQEVLIESALLSGEALINYRRHYQSGINMEHGLEMTLLNSRNPRSLIYQLAQLEMHFNDLPGNRDRMSEESKFLLEATTALKLSDIKALVKATGGVRDNLDQLLARVQYLISSAAKAISHRYFDHAEGPQLLVKNNDWQEHL